MKTLCFFNSQILPIVEQAGSGVPVSELHWEHDTTAASFYKWWAKYSGIDASLIRQMKKLENENRWLKNVFRRTIAIGNQSGGRDKKVVKQSQLSEMAPVAIVSRQINVRLAYNIFAVSETYYRYQAMLIGAIGRGLNLNF